MSEIETLAEPLLEEFDLDYEGLKVVAIGGGHGLAQALRAIQDYADVITAVVSVADDGGSSGRLTPDLGIPPPGDIRRALLALSPEPSLWRQLVEYRFEESDVSGHSLGNLILAALAELSGDFEDALRTAGRLLGARGAVVPVAPRPLELEAVVDGKVVRGQVAIAVGRGRITELRVLPDDVGAARSALDAVGGADQIVIGPGSLYTSLAATLLVPGMTEGVNASAAKLVYVANLTTQDGETLDMGLADHLRALVDTTGVRVPDAVVAHEGHLAVPEGVAALGVDRVGMAELGARLEVADLVDPEAGWPEHHPARLGAVLRRLA